MILLVFLNLFRVCKVQATPLREFSKSRGGRQSGPARDVQLDARRQRNPAPQRARKCRIAYRLLARAPARHLAERATNLIERSATLLHRLHSKQPLEMFGAVMVAAPQPEGRELSNRVTNGGRHHGRLCDSYCRIVNCQYIWLLGGPPSPLRGFGETAFA